MKWLRLSQVAHRVVRQFVIQRAPAAPLVVERERSGTWTASAERAASLTASGEFYFLNQKGKVRVARDWQDTSQSYLWLYNLHYFDDLNSRGSPQRKSQHRLLVAKWIADNAPVEGVGWEPYPTSLRIVNWIKWTLSGNELESSWRVSLALQAAWLNRNLEWHLLGNHLFSNAKALVFAGVFFSGEDARSWLRTGLDILANQLPEQVLPDGGHFERSPMYHQLALEDMLDLLNLGQTYPAEFDAKLLEYWRECAVSMLEWSRRMRHPDGDIVLFNDSAFGISPDPSEVDSYAARLNLACSDTELRMVFLKSSGYVVASLESAVLFADVAIIGPDYLPGHAHADTLSFELSVFDERWIVDTGCSVYEMCEERLRQRGTAAHNTVVVDGEDSSEVWSSFRVARRARPFDVVVNESDNAIEISASHDGYQRLRGKVSHRRRFRLSAGQIEIDDCLSGRFRKANANFLLHPDVSVQVHGDTLVLERSGQAIIFSCVGGHIEIEPATWNPRFGISESTHRISVALSNGRLNVKFNWQNVGV